MTPARVYKVRCEHRNVEIYVVRASSPEEARSEAESLADGHNMSISDSEVLSNEPDNGQEADND